MAKNFKFTALISFLLFLGIFFRICLFLTPRLGDVLVHYDWSKTIYSTGLNNSYFYPRWTFSPPTQPPLMMLAFWFPRHIYENRYILSELHNAIHIPPAFLILWFDKYGEYLLLSLWALFGDIFASLSSYLFIKLITKNSRLAIISAAIIFINPISIVENSMWQQNDLFAASFVYLAFYLLHSKNSFIYSSLLFVLGVLAKPTVLIIAPFFAAYFIYLILNKNKKIFKFNIFKTIVAMFLTLATIYLLFFPFINSHSSAFLDIFNIITQRISPGSKGFSLASVSAFNAFSLFFKMDNTYGSYKLLGIKLDTYSLTILFIINIYFISKFLKLKTKSPTQLLYTIFFIGQGTFLLTTSMLERYFFPAFIASSILIFIVPKKQKTALVLTQIIWLINIMYAYHLRTFGIVKELFWNNNYLLTRILSLINIVLFWFILKQKDLKPRPFVSQHPLRATQS